jgi:hypothetical protein
LRVVRLCECVMCMPRPGTRRAARLVRQVYGKTRKAGDIRRRWLAEGVDALCLEFPHLQASAGCCDVMVTSLYV